MKMSSLTLKGLLQVRPVAIQQVRYRNRLNIQRPQAPHHEKLKFLAIAKPIYAEDDRHPIEKCDKGILETKKVAELSPLDRIYVKEVRELFETSQLSAIFAQNETGPEEFHRMRVLFFKANMQIVQHKRAILEEALQGTKFENVLGLFQVHTMMVFCPEPNVKDLLKVDKRIPFLSLLAGVVENRILSVTQLNAYAMLPDIQIARAQLVQVLQSGAQSVVRGLQAHQNTLVQQLDLRIDQLKDTQSTSEVQCAKESKSESAIKAEPKEVDSSSPVEKETKEQPSKQPEEPVKPNETVDPKKAK